MGRRGIVSVVRFLSHILNIMFSKRGGHYGALPGFNPIKRGNIKKAGIETLALITRTYKKGIITFASKAFRDMTLYEKNLIGKPHNMVRYPFMPKAVFKEMWNIIKAGKHWSEIVVNQRRDGKTLLGEGIY